MKPWAFFLALIVTVGCQSVNPVILNGKSLSSDMKEQARKVVQGMAPGVVSVYGSGHSSGLIYEQKTILTVAHGKSESNVIQSEAGRFPVSFVWECPYLDLAFLAIDEVLTRSPFKITPAKSGERVLILARTANGSLRVIAGQVLLTSIDLPPSLLPQDRNTKDLSFLVETLILDAPAQPGDSGAPVFKLNGDLVGMVVAGNPSLGVTLATSAEAIAAERLSTKRSPSPYRPMLGKSLFKTLAEELHFLGRSLERYGKQIGKHDPKRLQDLVARILRASIKTPLSRRAHLIRFWRAYLEALEKR